MKDESKHTEAGGGSGGIGERRSRGERREFQDVVLSWAAAVETQRELLGSWEACVGNLQRLGGTLDGAERADKIVELAQTIKTMRDSEALSAKTRQYLDAILRDITAGALEP